MSVTGTSELSVVTQARTIVAPWVTRFVAFVSSHESIREILVRNRDTFIAEVKKHHLDTSTLKQAATLLEAAEVKIKTEDQRLEGYYLSLVSLFDEFLNCEAGKNVLAILAHTGQSILFYRDQVIADDHSGYYARHYIVTCHGIQVSDLICTYRNDDAGPLPNLPPPTYTPVDSNTLASALVSWRAHRNRDPISFVSFILDQLEVVATGAPREEAGIPLTTSYHV